MNEEIIKEIIFTGKVLYKEGLVNSHAGNISVREGEFLYITKTGKMLGYLKEDDIIKLPIYYESVKDRIASSELIVHREIYKKTDAQAVVHAHPAHTVVISFLVENSFTPVDMEGKLFLGEVPVIDVQKPTGSKELAEKLSTTLKEKQTRTVIVREHGSFVIGDNLNQALKLTSDLEFCSKVFYLLQRDRKF
ncbi:class II aldolase/adducin family protein [Persephonella sp.]